MSLEAAEVCKLIHANVVWLSIRAAISVGKYPVFATLPVCQCEQNMKTQAVPVKCLLFFWLPWLQICACDAAVFLKRSACTCTLCHQMSCLPW